MSIAEKLAQIAENEQRVYDAGYEKGKAEGGGGVNITFENCSVIDDGNGNITITR